MWFRVDLNVHGGVEAFCGVKLLLITDPHIVRRVFMRDDVVSWEDIPTYKNVAGEMGKRTVYDGE